MNATPAKSLPASFVADRRHGRLSSIGRRMARYCQPHWLRQRSSSQRRAATAASRSGGRWKPVCRRVGTLVVGGLNEGSWPRRAEPDRFMSRMMKGGLDLEPPERLIGLAAHDFMMAMGHQRIVLTRSARAGDAPATASRWLQRLLTFAGRAANAKDARARRRYRRVGARPRFRQTGKVHAAPQPDAAACCPAEEILGHRDRDAAA